MYANVNIYEYITGYSGLFPGREPNKKPVAKELSATGFLLTIPSIKLNLFNKY